MKRLLYAALAACVVFSQGVLADYWATSAKSSATYTVPLGTKADGPPVDASGIAVWSTT